jgi:hypothetical protein
MSLDVPLNRNETLLASFTHWPQPDAEPYAMALSDKAIFVIAKKKGFVLDNPWYLRRIPLTQVQSVAFIRTRPSYLAYFIGGLLLISGLIALVSVGAAVDAGIAPKTRFKDRAAVVCIAVACGASVIYGAKGRQAVVVNSSTERVVMAPPTRLGAPQMSEIRALQDDFLVACTKAGLKVERVV